MVTTATSKNSIQDCWNDCSDKWYCDNSESHEAIKNSPEAGFPIAVYPVIKKYLGNLCGKKVLVPSSGDSVGAFAFYLLGAQVTSCDLSERQIENARKIADSNGWKIEFSAQDTMTLVDIKSNEYDLVYTSNGTHVWINDMPLMYQNIKRVLKKGGYSIFFETHPMIRPFDKTTYDVKIQRHYTDVYAYANDEVPNYLWRTQDFINAVAVNGFVIREMLEFHSQQEDLPSHNYLYIDPSDTEEANNWTGDTFDWKNNPWAAFPQCLCLCSQKNS